MCGGELPECRVKVPFQAFGNHVKMWAPLEELPKAVARLVTFLEGQVCLNREQNLESLRVRSSGEIIRVVPMRTETRTVSWRREGVCVQDT